MVMAAVVSEILCYLQNNFRRHPSDNIRAAIIGFYKDEEVLSGKSKLFDFVDSLPSKPAGVPRCVKRQVSDNKRRLDCEDLINLYTVLDQNKVDLPLFVAGDLNRVPTVSPGEVDMFVLASTVAHLTSQLDMVMKK